MITFRLLLFLAIFCSPGFTQPSVLSLEPDPDGTQDPLFVGTGQTTTNYNMTQSTGLGLDGSSTVIHPSNGTSQPPQYVIGEGVTLTGVTKSIMKMGGPHHNSDDDGDGDNSGENNFLAPTSFKPLPICPSIDSSVKVPKRMLFNSQPNCQLGDNSDESSNCGTWLINVVIALKQGSNNDHLDHIKDFLREINKYCDDETMIAIFAPLYKNEKCETFSVFDTTVVKNLGGLESFIVQSKDSTYDTLTDIYDRQYQCSLNPMDKSGGLTLIFTNSDCSDFCEYSNSESTSTHQNKFITQLYYSGNWDEDQCVTNADSVFQFLNCQGSSNCGYSNVSLEDLQHEEVFMRTCKKQSDLNLLELLLIIGIPCLAMIVISLGCAYFCYKKSNIRWRKFFLREQLQKQNLTAEELYTLQHACSPPDSLLHKASGLARSPTSPNMNNYSEYFGKKIDESVCPWEIAPGNLLILDNKVLGHDVFPSLNLNCRHGDQIDVAIKRLPNHADEYARQEFLKEIDFMKTLGYHRHVISMFGCVTVSSCESLLVVEYCQHGDLLRFLRSRNKHVLLDEDEDCPIDAEVCLRVKDLVSISWQIADGMSYLSSLNFIHRDLAARNVLLTKSLVAKISDFGLGRHVDSTLYMAKGGRLPLKWMPPEALKFNEFSQKSDVWSYGIVLYELFSLGKQPFPTVQPFEMVEHLETGGRPHQPSLLPPPMFELQKWCLQLYADDRPTFEEIKNNISDLLNTNDEQYGYIDLGGSTSASKIKDFMEIKADKESLSEDEIPITQSRHCDDIDWLFIDERSRRSLARNRSHSLTVDSHHSLLSPPSPSLMKAGSTTLYEKRKEFALRQLAMEFDSSPSLSLPTTPPLKLDPKFHRRSSIATTPLHNDRRSSSIPIVTVTSGVFEPPPPYTEAFPGGHGCKRTLEEGLVGVGSILP